MPKTFQCSEHGQVQSGSMARLGDVRTPRSDTRFCSTSCSRLGACPQISAFVVFIVEDEVLASPDVANRPP